MSAQIPRPTPETHTRHRKETLWQIYLPLGIGVLLVIFLGILSGMASPTTTSVWADASLIFLMALSFLPLLILLALTAGLAYGIWRINQSLPPILWQVQHNARRISEQAIRITHKAAAPFIEANVWQARWQALWKRKTKS
ncbi:MAG: hypothetical protein Fur0018_22930 [Anaerolineales bacterium]